MLSTFLMPSNSLVQPKYIYTKSTAEKVLRRIFGLVKDKVTCG
jgi:hypothetical protein